MNQVCGDTNYTTPPLRGAQVFGGIAGLIGNGEQQQQSQSQKKDLDLISLASRSREMGARQDMYRCTLAASWQLQAGELNAEECIEDIFAGGDGWVSSSPFPKANSNPESKPASSASSVASRPLSRVEWWPPQRVSSASGESITLAALSDGERSRSGTRAMVGEGSSDSDSLSVATGGSGGSIAERRRQKRGTNWDSETRSLAGSDRRKAWTIDTGLDNLSLLSSGPGTGILPPKTTRKLSENNYPKTPSRSIFGVELNDRGEIDEVAAREDLKSWGRVR